MSNWEAEFAELVALYRAEARPKLAALGELTEALRPGAATAELKPLLERFHGFAGSGRSYGLPEVSELGLRGERLCLDLLPAAAVGADDVAELRRLARLLSAAFETAG